MAPTPGEHTRDFYRAQGEANLLAAILSELDELYKSKPSASWSPAYLINRIRGIYENRNAKN